MLNDNQIALLKIIQENPFIDTFELIQRSFRKGIALSESECISTAHDERYHILIDRLLLGILALPSVESHLQKVPGQPPCWFLSEQVELSKLSIDRTIELAIGLAHPTLRMVLPDSELKALETYKRDSLGRATTDEGKEIIDFSERIACHPSDFGCRLSLKPTNVITDKIKQRINDALRENYPIRISYEGGDGILNQLDIEPLGLICHHQLVYLVGRNNNGDHVLHLSVEKIVDSQRIEVVNLKRSQNFSIQQYLNAGHFNQEICGLPEKGFIRLRVTKQIREYFLTRFDCHYWTADEDFYIEYQCMLNNDMVGWLMSFGSQIEIIAPAALRDKVRDNVLLMHTYYRD